MDWLSLRVREDILTEGHQVVEVLRDGEVIGKLAGVTRAEALLRVNHIGQLTLTLDCSFQADGYRPPRPSKPGSP